MTGGGEPGRRTVLWLALFTAIAFALRVGVYYDAVFAHDYVTFVETRCLVSHAAG